MATLGELLTGLANKKQGLYDLLTGQATGGASAVLPEMTPITVEDKEVEFAPLKKDPYADSAGVRKSGRFASGEAPTSNELSLKQKISNALLGEQAPATDTINSDDTNALSSTISENPRRGGILRDIASGYNENRSTPISLENFGQNTLADGRNKGFAYRLGEGLGSLARIGESPLGRGLITAGLVGATGGSGLEALAYGGQAGALNQQNRSADQMYRNQLKDNYGYSEDDLNKVHGYINKDTFNNLTKSQNSAMNIAIKQQTTDSMNRLRELQTENLRIKNSYLPEKEKAELLKKNAEARYAEEYQLARIKALENSYINPLGWATYGLKADEFKEKQKQNQAKIDEQQAETELLKSLGGTSRANSNPLGI
jgi:hypothetical protein